MNSRSGLIGSNFVARTRMIKHTDGKDRKVGFCSTYVNGEELDHIAFDVHDLTATVEDSNENVLKYWWNRAPSVDGKKPTSKNQAAYG